jgi:hypothetical protein
MARGPHVGDDEHANRCYRLSLLRPGLAFEWIKSLRLLDTTLLNSSDNGAWVYRLWLEFNFF